MGCLKLERALQLKRNMAELLFCRANRSVLTPASFNILSKRHSLLLRSNMPLAGRWQNLNLLQKCIVLEAREALEKSVNAPE